MKLLKLDVSVSTLICCLMILLLLPIQAQKNLEIFENYNDCAAIFYKGKMLVNEYSPKGKCKLETGMEGKLTVSAVSLSDKGAIPTTKIGFQVAIQNNRTNTLRLISQDELFEVELKTILEQCEKGDELIFLTTDKKYSLPHHRVAVIDGC